MIDQTCCRRTFFGYILSEIFVYDTRIVILCYFSKDDAFSAKSRGTYYAAGPRGHVPYLGGAQMELYASFQFGLYLSNQSRCEPTLLKQIRALTTYESRLSSLDDVKRRFC